ncbi:MAG: DNA replication and repair protein RecF [Flavobacteriaceae bacterium]|nr:MAG: DNA replication and repair protein RecF [Flavobacteriaceae bacterium]
MYLKNIRIANFKNIEEKHLEFSQGINCFLGNNGVGKTNLLDAIYFLCIGKSYLNHSDLLNLRFDQDFLSVSGLYFHQNEDEISEDLVFCGFQKGAKKTIKKNGKAYSRISDHLGSFPVVMISPYDRDLIMEGSEGRRKFVDNIICQSKEDYLRILLRYNKCLAQRNALLKYFFANQTFDQANLSVYNQTLAELGEEIKKRREEFLEEFLPLFKDFYAKISSSKEEVALKYKPSVSGDLLEAINESTVLDRKLQYTTCGVHKDDFEFEIQDRSIKKYGSQGQQKSFLVALKLAKLALMKIHLKKTPILLLDDIFDKLDQNRVEEMIKMVNQDSFGQIFISDTHLERTQNLVEKISAESKVFHL